MTANQPAAFKNEHRPQLALVGCVPVKVSSENGIIRPGDPASKLSADRTRNTGHRNRTLWIVIGKALGLLDVNDADTGESISIEQLSILLHYSYGITRTITNPSLPEEHLSLRAAPSAGALYPLEIYLVVWNITGLESGLYHYCVVTHSLEQLKTGDFAKLACEYAMADDISDTFSRVRKNAR